MRLILQSPAINVRIMSQNNINDEIAMLRLFERSGVKLSEELGGYQYNKISQIADADSHLSRLRERYESYCSSLYLFFIDSWKWLFPHQPIDENWHLELICEYLECLYYGEFLKLLINIQPRVLKSITCSVIFPSWVWLRSPVENFLCLSYSGSLANDHNLMRKDLISLPQYQQLFSVTPWDKFELRRGKNRLSEFANNYRGQMFARGFDGSVTGVGGSYIVCLPAEQKINTSWGLFPIAAIVENSWEVPVLTYNHDTQVLEWSPILEYEENEVMDRSLIEIELDDGTIISCTEDHLIWVNSQEAYVKAGDLQVGDDLLCSS